MLSLLWEVVVIDFEYKLEAEKWTRSLSVILGEIISLIIGFGYMKVFDWRFVGWGFICDENRAYTALKAIPRDGRMDCSSSIPFARLTFFYSSKKLTLDGEPWVDGKLKASVPPTTASVTPSQLLSLQFLVIRIIKAYVLLIPYYKESLRLYLTSFINVLGTFCSKAS